MCVKSMQKECNQNPETKSFSAYPEKSLGLSLTLEDVLDDLCLFDQKGPDNARPDTSGATRTTVSTADRLLTLRDRSKFTRTVSLDTGKVRMAITAFGHASTLGDVEVTNMSTGSLDDLATSRLGVVRVALAQSYTLGHLKSNSNAGQKERQYENRERGKKEREKEQSCTRWGCVGGSCVGGCGASRHEQGEARRCRVELDENNETARRDFRKRLSTTFRRSKR